MKTVDAVAEQQQQQVAYKSGLLIHPIHAKDYGRWMGFVQVVRELINRPLR